MHLLRPGSRLRQTNLTARAMGGVSGLPSPPAGYAYLLDSSGAYILDSSGAYILTLES